MKLFLLGFLTTALGFRPSPLFQQPAARPRQTNHCSWRPTTTRLAGGRAPGGEDNLKNNEENWTPAPCNEDEARLTVIQITDVYTLEHLASVKTLVEEGIETISLNPDTVVDTWLYIGKHIGSKAAA